MWVGKLCLSASQWHLRLLGEKEKRNGGCPQHRNYTLHEVGGFWAQLACLQLPATLEVEWKAEGGSRVRSQLESSTDPGGQIFTLSIIEVRVIW